MSQGSGEDRPGASGDEAYREHADEFPVETWLARYRADQAAAAARTDEPPAHRETSGRAPDQD